MCEPDPYPVTLAEAHADALWAEDAEQAADPMVGSAAWRRAMEGWPGDDE